MVLVDVPPVFVLPVRGPVVSRVSRSSAPVGVAVFRTVGARVVLLPGSAELIRPIQVEVMCFQAHLKVISDCCRISNVWWQLIPKRRAKIQEGTITFFLYLENGSFRRLVLLRKRDDGLKNIREISGIIEPK